MSETPEIAADETTGFFRPTDVRPSDWPRLDGDLLARLRALPGLTPTASDVMEELGLALVAGADLLKPRVAGSCIAGQAVTIRYLPERRLPSARLERGATSRLAHHVVYSDCRGGEVLVIEVAGDTGASTFGGMAALEARRHGLAGVIVDGAVRDLDELEHVGLPVWSRSATPRTGKWRLEAVQINGPVCCAGHQVHGGDLVLADMSGVCIIPIEFAEKAVDRTLEVAMRELRHLEDAGLGRTGQAHV